MPHRHWLSVVQALFVTLLWSSSWVLIKWGLADMPPLTFAGLRYALAFVCLLPVALPRITALIRSPKASRPSWLQLAALGLILYTVTQGAQFLSLWLLPAVTASLVLSFSPIAVAWMGLLWLQERPSPGQWFGLALFLVGALLYLLPLRTDGATLAGLAVALVGLAANAASAVLGRALNRDGRIHPLALTTVSMGIGGLTLLVVGLATQGLPPIPWTGWAVVGWLAVVNTALAFTLWNHTLRTLSAVESSVINNTMLVQIAVLAWVFLGESLGARELVGLALAVAGTLVVQLRRF